MTGEGGYGVIGGMEIGKVNGRILYLLSTTFFVISFYT
jgi:hypothetical protein